MAKLDGLFRIGNKSDEKPSIKIQFDEATEKSKLMKYYLQQNLRVKMHLNYSKTI